VYVPIGADNKLSISGGTFNGAAQPVVFKSGSTGFEVPFEGLTLRWELRTYESNRKTSVASDASSSSTKCNYISGGTARQTELMDEQVVEQGPIKVSVFPNPASGSVIVNSNEDLQDAKSISVYDVSGRMCAVKIARRISARSYVLDVSALPKGLYLIRVKTAEGYTTVRIVKQQ
jgi:hypothetical protein